MGQFKHEIQIKLYLSASLGMIMYANDAYFSPKVPIRWL